MLEDRDYMRSSSTEAYRSVTVALIATLVITYLAQIVADRYYPGVTDQWFALSLNGIREHRYWQVLTFQFMHGGFFHLLFNCLGLFFFGRAVESALGKARFLALYFAGGTIGGILQVAMAWVLPVYFGGGVVGASAGLMAVIAAFAVLFAEQDITTFIFFFPVTFRAKYFLWFSLAFEVVCLIFRLEGGIAHAAHLGGLLTGVACLRWFNTEWQLSGWHPFQARQRRRELVRTAPARSKQLSRPRKDAPADLPSEEFISKEVDPILDKISAHGIQSLTDRERQILQAARAKMSKR